MTDTIEYKDDVECKEARLFIANCLADFVKTQEYFSPNTAYLGPRYVELANLASKYVPDCKPLEDGKYKMGMTVHFIDEDKFMLEYNKPGRETLTKDYHYKEIR
jgi:hypothetical protein